MKHLRTITFWNSADPKPTDPPPDVPPGSGKAPKILLLMLLIAGCCFAQAPAVANNFLMAGVTWNQDAAPPFSGWGSFGKCVFHDDSGPCRIYSFTTWDVTFYQETVAATVATPTTPAVAEHLRWKQQYSQRTGGALVAYGIPSANLSFILLGDAGAAQTVDAIGASYSAGGGAVWAHKSGFLLTALWRDLKTTNSNNPKDFRFGLGWRF